MTEGMLITKLEKIDNYLNSLTTAINQLKAASFIENDKMHGYAAKQAEILSNEIDKEILNVRRINITDEVMEKEINTRLLMILEEARRLSDKKMQQQMF